MTFSTICRILQKYPKTKKKAITLQRTASIQKLTSAALLVAVGIIIPMFSPIKILLEPASFTLASHVPVFLAMFISPLVALAVAAGTTIGFFFGGFPLVVVARAATHVLFVLVGAFFLKYHPSLLSSFAKTQVFSFFIGILHAAAELAVVGAFFLWGNMPGSYYEKGFLISGVLLVGVGSIIHSMVDFGIAYAILKLLAQQKSMKKLFQYG